MTTPHWRFKEAIYEQFARLVDAEKKGLYVDFIEALSDVATKPAAMEQILRINQGREVASS